MSNELGYPKSGWRFVACLRFEQTKKDGRKCFINRQDLPASSIESIISTLKHYLPGTEFHDEAKPNAPVDDGILDITAEGKHFSGEAHTQKARLSWQFKKSTSVLLPGEELDCRVSFHWISGKADATEPGQGAPQARIQFNAVNKMRDWAATQLIVLTGPRKQHYKNLARTVKVLPGPGDSREYRVKCLVPSRDHVKTNRLSLLIYTNVGDSFRGVEAIYEWKDPLVPDDTEPVKLDNTNSMRPLHQSDKRPPLPDVKSLVDKGYYVYLIESIKILYANVKNPDAPLAKQPVGKGGFDVVANGTYTYTTNPEHNKAEKHQISAGAIMRNGVLDTPGVDRAIHRGGLGVLKDGTIVIARIQGNSAAAIQKRFGPVRDFLGGAALLINGGKPVSGKELFKVEKFGFISNKAKKSQNGFDAPQMDKTYHTLVGIRNGQAYLMVAREKSGLEIQKDLIEENFGTALKLDGRSGCFLKDIRDGKPRSIYRGKNSVGMGIHIRKQ